MKAKNNRIILFLFLLNSFFLQAQNPEPNHATETLGAITRLDSTKPNIYLIFSAHKQREGGNHVYDILHKNHIPASFFFTGDFYREKDNASFIKDLLKDGHYLGAHSNTHLLYAPWEKRDSTLVTKTQFLEDLQANYQEMDRFGITKKDAPYFLPPYEYYNQEIADWTQEFGLQLINYTSGTGTARDFTWPEMGNRYTSSKTILKDLFEFEKDHNLNGFIIIVHMGTDLRRKDKFYWKLQTLINRLQTKGYSFKRL